MSFNADTTCSRSQRAEQNSQKPLSRPESVRSQGRPASHPRLLRRKKSSDSASTSTAVTTSEDTNRTTTKLPDHGVIAGAPPFIAIRRSRSKLEAQRSDRELSSREAVRKTTYGSYCGLKWRETPPDIAVADQSRRDEGKAVTRSAHTPSTRRLLPESPMFADSESSDKLSYSGQLAYAEFERLKKEIDFWKKAATDNEKQAKNQAKKVEELETQILAETLAKKEQEMQVQTVKGKMEKKEELITTIETSLQCQICTELIHRPYALSPCGHILCLYCLQEWFRRAPPARGDDEYEDESSYVLNRAKSCPCCRTVITQRPIPVFIVKAITTALDNHRATVEPGMSIRNRSPSPSSGDPWKGLFYSTDDDYDDDGIDDFEASEEAEAYEDAMRWGVQVGFRGGFDHQQLEDFEEDVESETGGEFEVGEELEAFEEDVESETGGEFEVGEGLEIGDEQDTVDDGDGERVNSYECEEYENVYVPARWEPPSVVIDPEMYVFRNQGVAASILRMLRRGCTVDMIRLFEITYSHDKGLVAHLPSLDDDFSELSHIVVLRNNRVFLGWNIYLDGEDYTGELYMRRVLIDMRQNPEQWLWTERAYFPGAFDVKLLMRIEEVNHYDTTDTVW